MVKINKRKVRSQKLVLLWQQRVFVGKLATTRGRVEALASAKPKKTHVAALGAPKGPSQLHKGGVDGMRKLPYARPVITEGAVHIMSTYRRPKTCSASHRGRFHSDVGGL